jgi:hypothetical protein
MVLVSGFELKRWAIELFDLFREVLFPRPFRSLMVSSKVSMYLFLVLSSLSSRMRSVFFRRDTCP